MDLFISIHPPRVGWDGGGMGGFNYEIPISIHPPRVGWDQSCAAGLWNALAISIHPPRVGWDPKGRVCTVLDGLFQSTHPVWGGTSGLSLTGSCY